MEFPTNEEDIIALAEKMIEGLTNHPDIFPSPPVSAEELRKKLNQFIALKKADADAKAKLLQSTIARDEAFKKLFDAVGDKPTKADGNSPVPPMLWNWN